LFYPYRLPASTFSQPKERKPLTMKKEREKTKHQPNLFGILTLTIWRDESKSEYSYPVRISQEGHDEILDVTFSQPKERKPLVIMKKE
jgi:hypothetical protein